MNLATAWASEVLPAIAGGHCDEQIGMVMSARTAPQAVTAVALGAGRGARNSTRTTSRKKTRGANVSQCASPALKLSVLSTSRGVASRSDDQPTPHEKIGLKKQQFGRGEQVRARRTFIRFSSVIATGEPVILDRMPVAWIIVATWIIGLCLIALIRAWIRRNETPRH